MALVPSTSFAFASSFECGAKCTHRLHVSPPGSGPRQVDAPTKKSLAAGPLKLSPAISRSAAPVLVTVTSCGALTVLCGWVGNSSPFGPTAAAGRVSAVGIGLTWPEAFEPQHATAPLERTAHEWEYPALRERKVPAGGVARPAASSPTQASVASSRIPHEWS